MQSYLQSLAMQNPLHVAHVPSSEQLSSLVKVLQIQHCINTTAKNDAEPNPRSLRILH